MITDGACRYVNRCNQGHGCRRQHIVRCIHMDQFEKPKGLTNEELEKVTHEYVDKVELLQSTIKEKNERINELIDESEQLEKESYNNAINDVISKLNEHKEIVKEMSKNMIENTSRSDRIHYIKNRGRLSMLNAKIRNIKELLKD